MRWLFVLMVLWSSSASAGARWPDSACRDVRLLQEHFDSLDGPVADKANARSGLLILRGNHCGDDVRAQLEADTKLLERSARRRVSSTPAPMAAPREPTNCVTLKLDRDLATTRCD